MVASITLATHGEAITSSCKAKGPCTSIPSQATQEREAQLADELAVLSGELARTRAVAARATAREVGNGTKDEGIVPMTMHLEEVTLPFTPGNICETSMPCP